MIERYQGNLPVSNILRTNQMEPGLKLASKWGIQRQTKANHLGCCRLLLMYRVGRVKWNQFLTFKGRLFVTFLLTYHFTKSLAFETDFFYLKVRMLSWIFGFLMEETVVIQKYLHCWSKAAKMLFKRLILFDLPYFVPPWNLPCFHGICVVVTLPKESHYRFF